IILELAVVPPLLVAGCVKRPLGPVEGLPIELVGPGKHRWARRHTLIDCIVAGREGRDLRSCEHCSEKHGIWIARLTETNSPSCHLKSTSLAGDSMGLKQHG